MRRLPAFLFSCVLALSSGCALEQKSESKGQISMFIGFDVSGSFTNSPYFENSLDFAAHYIYAHLNELGGLKKPKALFVGTIGGEAAGEVKAFHPIHEFRDRSVEQIRGDLKKWFSPKSKKGNPMTDFNAFFRMVATMVKRQGLVLAPIEVIMISDGVPEVSGKPMPYSKIDMSALEYLARRVTVRLLYASPTVGDKWERDAPRKRIRFWPREAEVMAGWKKQMEPGVKIEDQQKFFSWVTDNVDFRVKTRKIF